ncbi:hypothetical protein CTI12_AA080820 [Artemisia annua]|uniref:Helitron helicase-like domain-containing protein n=1 Tax=Artemisia annua TaxID=35608 RepID=A0A2U1Q046_ARTAN|nr:hypothetical protein CTI12_AA080820 [Artemisia annua]
MKTKQKAVRRNLPYLDPYLDVQQMDISSATSKRKNPVCEDTTSNTCNGNVSKKICQRQGALGHQNSLESMQTSDKGQQPLPESHRSTNVLYAKPKSTANSIRVSTDATDSPLISFQRQMPSSLNSVAESSQLQNTKRASNRNYKRHRQIRNKEADTTVHSSNTPHNINNYRKRPRFMQDLQRSDTYIQSNRRQRRRTVQGNCDQVCSHCKALFWYDERIKSGSPRFPQYHRCCNNGKVSLPANEDCPDYMKLKLFRTARDKMETADIADFKLKLFGVSGSKQYDLPTGDSIGAIVFEGGQMFLLIMISLSKNVAVNHNE